MSHLLAINIDVDAAPAISLKGQDGDAPRGWGFAWYPGSGLGATTFKGPVAVQAPDGERVTWERQDESFRYLRRQRSTTIVGYFGAPGDRPRRDLDPFVRSYAGRDWVLAYDGEPTDLVRALPLEGLPLLEPVGAAREHPLAWLVSRLLIDNVRTISALGGARLRELLAELDGVGVGNVVLSDGDTLAVYAAQDAEHAMGWARHLPPATPEVVETDDILLGFDTPADRQRTIVVAGTAPATEGWEALAPGELLMLRRGVVADAVAGPAVALPPRRRRVPSMPDGERVMDVLHETTYRYDAPVARSSHTLRLEPVHDRLQEVLRHEVTLSVGGARSRYEDVFGNLAHAVEIDTPYEELTVRSESRVLLRSGPDPRRTVGGNPRMPLMWMPWQRQMLLSYLLPPELPETQLRELNDYALSFARRNDGSVIATLWDVNETIHRDYAYVSGSTSLETTPFDVYVTRRGVCQDFANLFICLARLLGVPARYRVGYIHTGADYANRIQSDASHAWCEMYLPWLGWVGLDPTNGCLAGLDHVRVACGRNFLDATPTAGTIWQGGGGERLQVRVEVVPREAPAPAGAGA